MAESAVSFVLEKLGNLLIEETLFLYGVKAEVKWLKKELEWMQCFLIDAEARRIREGSAVMKKWLREVREIAHQAEDIIDIFTLEVESNKTQKKKNKRGFLQRLIKRYAAFPCALISRHNVGMEILGLKADIEHIKKGKEEYKLSEITPSSATTATADENLQRRRRIHAHEIDTLVVGLDVHKKEIADRLLDPIKRRCVVSIVGVGGLGKTTLANKVFNDNKIKAEFDVSACISVSEDYKVHEILKALVKQMMGKTMAELQSEDVDELGGMLREFLMQKRYLILFDDVWSPDVWDYLIRAALPEVNNGSRVLITTRRMDVANSINPTILRYELPFLNKDDSWALFLNRAFPSYQEESSSRCPKELEEIGRRLVERCGGLREAREEDLFNIYNTKTSNSSSTTDLQDTINNNHGKNLRRLVVHGDISTTTSADLMLPPNLKSILQFGTDNYYASSSIIIPNGQLKLLRVIHLVDVGKKNDEEFPEKFDKMMTNMRQLRYLRWSGFSINIKIFPACIRNMCNLQTLHLSRSGVSVLPDWLGEIRTLRHLYLDNIYDRSVSCLGDVGSLTNLQTLEVWMDASEGGWMERWGLEKLVNIRLLQVRYLKGEEDVRVLIESLRKMKYLSSLRVLRAEVIPIELFSGLSENTHLRYLFLWGPIKSLPQQVPAESLHGSGFPPNLTTLYLYNSELVEDPMATLEKLPYLRKLELSQNVYIGKEMVCTSGGFPRLQELWLSDLDELEEWRVEDGAMPNLTTLLIWYCRKLGTVPEGLQHLRSLQKLELRGYPNDRVRPEVGEDWYKIQHVPQIISE